ncbi:MAG TPA: L,D-transpeptidase family protein [Terriglobales bacterium]|nr:L,D-transpeptidase family protein [Terriglobales bacterium]
MPTSLGPRGKKAIFLCLTWAILALNPDVTGNSSTASRVTLTPEAHSSQTGENRIRDIIDTGQLSVLRWPNFSDYRSHLKNFYGSSRYSLAWIRENHATTQAQALIEVLQHANSKGLNSEDYDASRWDARLQQLSDSGNAADFDAALTICAMRYVSDLRIGKVNPRHFRFGLNVERKKYDLAQFVRSRLANGDDIPAALREVEPPFPGYKRTLAALQRYLALSQEDDGEKLPELMKSITPGKEYAGIPRLTRLLHLLGDLPSSADLQPGNVYQGPLVLAVKSFQARHGLSSDGVLGMQTVKQLNIPLRDRVEQLRLTLERWRWVPNEFPQPPVVVNIPEFRLRAYDQGGVVVLTSNVVVGKAYRHETPVFENEMRYVVFRPYWNVPPSIQRSEIVPAIQRDGEYVAKHNYEVTTSSGTVVTSGTITDEVLQQLKAGKLAVRQKPGPNNALGLVKLIFPNAHNVYLHSTPSQQLFAQSRRDFSHGCIRVEKAAELAAWALATNKEDWTLERVLTIMHGSEDNVQVNLTRSIPVLILYATAVVEENGVTHFFDDIYGYDADLEKVLAKGYPYPN